MSYRAHDGKRFATVIQGRKWDRYLDEQRVQSQVDRGKQDIENAPGGELHEKNLKEHGVCTEAHIVNEGSGRWRLTTKHADGAEVSSVHPQWFRAHELAGKHFDPDGKPAALETHQRARSHPTGKKEEERIAREDNREVDDAASRWEDFQDDK